MSRQPGNNDANLRVAIDRMYDRLADLPVGSPEHIALGDQILKFHATKQEDTKVNSSKRLSADVLVTVIANLAGVAMIVEYERAAVVTSKAIAFITKLTK
jgi:hypothetical protein